ncbi:MAG: monovalent cation/H(+) antiporter subunit G [Betaproteobacteria bacterium]|jgi:multicomponent K+:H+ antiporter subunit G
MDAAELLVSILLVTGSAFTLLGSIGLARFPDPLARLHGPAKSATLGLGGLLLASMAFFTWQTGVPSLHELLITVFVALGSPVSALCIGRAARARRI